VESNYSLIWHSRFPQESWRAGQNYRRIEIEVLEQQEAISYMPDGKSFIYDIERDSGERDHAV